MKLSPGMKRNLERHLILVAAALALNGGLILAGLRPSEGLAWLVVKACKTRQMELCAHRPGEPHVCRFDGGLKEVKP